MLSRYQRIRFPEDEIREDLMKTPYAESVELSNKSDIAVVDLRRVPYHEIFPLAAYGDIREYLSQEREKLELRKVPKSNYSMPYGYYSMGVVLEDISWHINLVEYCQANDLSYEIYRDESEIPVLVPTGKNLLCHLGLHKYEQEPEIKEFVRSTGLDFLFFSSGIQHGIRRCRRCGNRQHVLREGLIGSGLADKWRRCSEHEAKEVDLLPLM